MARDFSFENKITDGYVQIVKQFTLDFDKASIVFENVVNRKQKSLQFSRITAMSMLAYFNDDFPNDINDVNAMVYRNLIGFDFEEKETEYIYTIKVDDYEITIKSLDFVTLENLD